MVEPQKPFVCSLPDCGMSFTNEDHLHVHTKKHDMVLQLGMEQAGKTFVADQTPTPTRFIRNCEEVGLFQDLQNVSVNPFDEGFKRAMETKHGILTLDNSVTSDDVLHTPQMVFPLIEHADATLFNSNNQRNITISRSSSDESGTIKEYERTTISKLTNEITTISRVIENRDDKADDVADKNTDRQKDVVKTNVIKIESNVEIRKDSVNIERTLPTLVYKDAKDVQVNKDVTIDNTKLLPPDKIPIMSQKSLDFVVDSLTSDLPATSHKTPNIKEKKPVKNNVEMIKLAPKSLPTYFIPNGNVKNVKQKNGVIKPTVAPKKEGDYEVIIKMPDGKQVRMLPVEEITKPDTKSLLKKTLIKKTIVNTPKALPIQNILQIPGGTLIPVTLVDQSGAPISTKELSKIPITKVNQITNNLSNMPLITTNVLKTVPKLVNVVNKTQSQNLSLKTLIVNKVDKKNMYTNNNKNSVTPNKNTQFFEVKVSEPFQIDKNTGKRKSSETTYHHVTEEAVNERLREKSKEMGNDDKEMEGNDDEEIEGNDDCVIKDVSRNPEAVKRTRFELESRCAASKRYRERLKTVMRRQSHENKLLREANQKLVAEKAVLKLLITEHMKRCPNAEDLRLTQERLNNSNIL